MVCKSALIFQGVLNTPAGDIHGPKDAAITKGLAIYKKNSVELCFVQFYEFSHEKNLTVDQVYSILDSIRLQWQ